MSKIIYGTIATAVGLRKLNTASLAGSKVEITKVKYGDSSGIEYQPTGDELDIKNTVYESKVNSVNVDDLNPNWVNIESVIPSNIGGFWVREMGLYDESGDMIFITAVSPREKPVGQPQSIDMSFDIIVETINPDTLKVFFDPNKAIASQSFVEKLMSDYIKTRVGEIAYFHDANHRPEYLNLDGSEILRSEEPTLWGYAQSSGLMISQADKDSDKMRYAMHFGSGDGALTFTLPNHHLGHFLRGNPEGVEHGETQGDAIRNITGFIDTNADIFSEGVSGAFRHGPGDTEKYLSSKVNVDTNFGSVIFDASTVVPTANENRPYTANLSVRIHRGRV
ncbi:hypothetical protein NVP1111B_25 [Vibrio phage 1.111.B._10N.286.45.E6]|nr:hypothetical protein NVP1111A_25 [Vibrio phage 1.111.A._10N.286.45.E6]AUR88281.1 hypothetical protein NVP1111B_25 [Vibrio phage 1.111.B._10N.286.45.E6]